jgi:sulfite oxidase
MDVDSISLGVTKPPKDGLAVGLSGYDTDEVGNQYCCSFPFEKAIDPYGDVIIAYEMNGVEIPRSHGYPVRAIVPGIT